MKKSLVLAMAMALGVTVSAYAANPFSDVPAGHWAYDSVAKLAAAGVVDGYPDGTFRGDRLMTRYEMAQIVAKAMARGANVDRLAAEFADELDALGVRVAALEKKADNVKITGNVRYSYSSDKIKSEGEADEKSYANKLRSRLTFTGDINKDWNYVGLIENNQNFKNNVGDEDVKFQRAYLDGRLGGMHVTAGRFNNIVAEGNIYDTRVDGIKATYGSVVKVGGYYAKPTNFEIKKDNRLVEGFVEAEKKAGKDMNLFSVKSDRTWGVNLSTDIGKLNISGGYDRFEDFEASFGKDAYKPGPKENELKDDNAAVVKALDGENLNIWNAALKYNFGEASLAAMYLHSNVDVAGLDNDGFVITGTVKGAKASKPGSWGLEAKYYDQGAGTFLAHTMNGDYAHFYEGFKGYKAGASVAVAKNAVATVEYYDLKSKVDSSEKARTLWSQMVFTF